MIVRSFTGRTMTEALDKVKANMGDDALIIETRSVTEPGLFGKKIGIEVVAAKDNPNKEAGTLPGLKAMHEPSIQAAAPIEEPHISNNPWQPISVPAEPEQTPIRPAATAPATVSVDAVKPLTEHDEHLGAELKSIRRQLARLASGTNSQCTHLEEDIAQTLRDNELPEDCIAELDEALAQAGDRLPAAKRPLFMQRVLEKRILTPGGINWDSCKQLLVVGPTGVGKTTTIAKLAGDLVLKQNRSVALVTIDTYRIGAAEQLQSYADLLDLPFEVASTPEQLHAVLERFRHCDNILIDTAGRNPSDSARLHELRDFCHTNPAMHVMLALSATSGRAEFASVVERFSLLPIEHSCITKMDELMAPGRLYGCLRRHQLPVHYCTTGQEVPDDIVVADGPNLTNTIFEPAFHTSEALVSA